MYNVAKLNNKNRKELFNKYIEIKGGNPAIVEKDFWVSLMLDYLFNKCKYKDYFIFKGGTSLSKCYNLINRFSEDIDLTLDHNLLGISDKDLYNSISNTSRKKIIDKTKEKLEDFIKNKLIKCLENDLKKYIIDTYRFEVEEKDKSIVNFYYPNVYEAKPAGLLQCIRLEIGAISELVPNETKEIAPLISIINTPVLNYKKFKVKTISPVKTFWEKVLILHQEAHRPLFKPNSNKEPYNIPSRYSRHYYDVWKISQSKYKDLAKNNIKLFIHLIEFRDKFYHYSWNKICEAKTGALKLVPNSTRIKELKKDFDSMKEMINDKNIKSFDILISNLKELENELNNYIKR